MKQRRAHRATSSIGSGAGREAFFFSHHSCRLPIEDLSTLMSCSWRLGPICYLRSFLTDALHDRLNAWLAQTHWRSYAFLTVGSVRLFVNRDNPKQFIINYRNWCSIVRISIRTDSIPRIWISDVPLFECLSFCQLSLTACMYLFRIFRFIC